MTDPRLTRRHAYLRDRGEQIAFNHKALEGGRPYIAARLARHACEGDASWAGVSGTLTRHASQGTIGRKDRAFFINYAGRIARKINQLVSSAGVQRDGIGESFASDATRTGMSIGQFMDRIGEFVTAGGWCWIGIDRQAAMLDESGNPLPRSVADREASGDRVWWSAWRAHEVVDWKFAPDGKLDWLITEQPHEEVTTPDAPPGAWTLRTVWQRGGGVRIYIDPAKPEKAARVEPFTIGADVVPFVPVGIPSACPWWFDDVEMVCASILNLDSCHDQNLVQSVFPQLVVPSGMLQGVMEQAGVAADQAVTMVRGLNFPMLEGETEKGITRYIQPSASDLEAIPRETGRRKMDLFEIVGMALRVDTSNVESAEAKRLGLLDTSAVLAQRSEVLQAGESAAVELSMAIDANFDEYQPVYPTEFDVGDVKGDLESLLLINSLDMPTGARKELTKAGIDRLGRLGRLPRERVAELKAEADESGMDESLALLAGGSSASTSGTVADTAMNGAQVAALIEIAKEAASKGLPVESAKAIARAAFPAIDGEEMDSIFSALKGFNPPAPVETPA